LRPRAPHELRSPRRGGSAGGGHIPLPQSPVRPGRPSPRRLRRRRSRGRPLISPGAALSFPDLRPSSVVSFVPRQPVNQAGPAPHVDHMRTTSILRKRGTFTNDLHISRQRHREPCDREPSRALVRGRVYARLLMGEGMSEQRAMVRQVWTRAFWQSNSRHARRLLGFARVSRRRVLPREGASESEPRATMRTT
jgi:hypothetical protein